MDDLQKLIAAVKDVRSKQRQFFAMRRAGNINAQTMLEASKDAEKKLDQLIKELENKQKPQHPTLF